MMADTIFDKYFRWRLPKLKDFLLKSKEKQDDIEKRVDAIEKRVATLNGESEWMDNSSKFEGYKGVD